jgi:hypothetical protein
MYKKCTQNRKTRLCYTYTADVRRNYIHTDNVMYRIIAWWCYSAIVRHTFVFSLSLLVSFLYMFRTRSCQSVCGVYNYVILSKFYISIWLQQNDTFGTGPSKIISLIWFMLGNDLYLKRFKNEIIGLLFKRIVWMICKI